MEYLSPQGVLLPLVYGTTASPLWLELRGLSAWQATPSSTVYRLACQRLLPRLRVTFAMVPDAAWPGSDQRPWGTAPAAGPLGWLCRPNAPYPWGVGSFLSLDCPTCARVCGVLGHLAPVHGCARLVRCFACEVSWATWLLFTGVRAGCVVLLVRCPGPLGSCSLVCPLGVLFCLCGVLGHLAPAHQCARLVRCFACEVSWATWLLLTGVPARCVVLYVRCPGPLGSCSLVCRLGVLFCLCGVLGHLAPVHQCARLVRCFACEVYWATWLLFTGVPARCGACVGGVLGHSGPVHPCARSVCCFACAVFWATWLLFTSVPAWCVSLLVTCPGPLGFCSPVCPLGVLFCLCGVLGHLAHVHRWARSVWCLCVRCPGPLGSCSPVCPLGVLFCLFGVLGHFAPVHRCARSVWCLCVRCPWPLGSCSPVCPLGALFCLCGVLGHLASVHLCARSVWCVACVVSWATWLLFTCVPARCGVLRVRCPGRLGSCSPVCLLGVLCCVCGVLGHLAPGHRCARSVPCFACAVSLATWILYTGVPARCVALRVRCPGPLGSFSPVCPLGVVPVCAVSWATWLLFTGVPAWCVVLLVRCLGYLAPVHRCARLACCVACAVSWATWLLFTSVPARCGVLHVRCPGPLGFYSPVCPLGVLCCVCGVLGHLAPVHRCAHLVRCFACAVSLATWILFTGAPARCVTCVCGVQGHLAPVQRCARSVCSFACAVSWATWLLFTCVPARCGVLRVRCPGRLGSCSPVCLLGVLCCVCGVLGHLAPVHRCARSVPCFACAVSLATWILYTGVPARCVALRVRCPGPLGSFSPVCPLGVVPVCAVSWATWLLFTGVPAWCVVLLVRCLGYLAPVHRCARLACCVACAVSWATWLLFTSVPARCGVLHVRCVGPLGFYSPVCPLGVLCCVCGVLGHLAPVHRCAHLVRCFACAVSWATWILLTGAPARCVTCVCGVQGHLAPVQRCARSVCSFACAVSWATWLLFTGVPARCGVLRMRCPGRLGSCSPVCPLGVLCCVCGVLGHLAPVHRCARSVRCFACAVSWATWILYTGVPARCVALRVRCPGPLGSFSPMCPLGVVPVCAVSWATWLLFTGVPAWCVVLLVRCPGPLGSCSPVCPLGVVCCVCGVLGHLASVHRCARSVCCVAFAVSWATWLLFTDVPTWCVALRVRCPGSLGSCSPARPLGVLPVCAVSRAT